ncbi:MAG: FAD-dependent monooxygenase [Pseudomonadota bacterium]
MAWEAVMESVQSVAIAGAGLGGLTAAACLLEAGFHVTVYEQAPALGEVGAGIQISANGSSVLHALGLREDLERIGVKPMSYDFHLFDSAERLQGFDLGVDHEQRFGSCYYQFHRADLHAVLVQAVQSRRSDAIELNKTCVGYDESDSCVRLKFADGSDAKADLLIGADGIKSAVREQLVGVQNPVFTGQAAWRIIVPADRLPSGFMEQRMYVWVGPGKHAVTYYLRGGELVNLVGCVDSDWNEEGWTIKASWDELKADYQGWCDTIQRILDAADKDACYRWALNNRPALDTWHSQRVVMLGDAVHSTLPYMAQGAVMAIEDAAVLTRVLESDEPLPDALARYQRNRLPRTTRIVNESTSNAKLFHHESEQALRDAFARRGDIGRDRANWLYSYKPLSVELD